ncbi:MAG: hypothetical protein GWM90_10550 [Gemmatimonadetes bacterium]|nr:hypothetical protein [Gemmatimonadota bacterium]NIQ54390.1 hypothetical protein [Gemmatimonadota bacterium]NIU74600.1 hypothetical protein [Gammaproteobacteria bacterium]NIX44537.1 hypothetical protein [Gemmatimonadota bacterium]NIY08760.1 hypothetical protein [Gemmatimonadota bacterium]
MRDDDREEILRRIEAGAVRDAAERSADEAEAVPDLVRELGGHGREGPAPDLTFGGYVETHDRPPAFEGSDGQPYTVDLDTEETGDPERPWAAFLVFIRWAATGAGIMGHLTSEDVAWGGDEHGARAAALDLTLYELKTRLDRAIAVKAELMEE